MYSRFQKLKLFTFFEIIALFVLTVIFVAANENKENEIFSLFRGNWSVWWIIGNKPRRTTFVIEVSDSNFFISEEVQSSTMMEFGELFLRFIQRIVEKNETLSRSNCIPNVWIPNFSVKLRPRISNNFFYLTDCAEEILFSLGKNFLVESAFGTILSEPHPFYFQLDNKCSLAPFKLKGYWLEWLNHNEVLVIIMLRNGSEDCTHIFQLSKHIIQEKDSHSSLMLIALLVLAALLKFIPRIYLKKTNKFIGVNNFSNSNRRVLSDVRRRELLQQQAEIIRRMKEEDGKL